MAPTKPEAAVQGLARLARSVTDGTVSPDEHARGRERLLAAVEDAPRGSARPFTMGETPKPPAQPVTMGDTPKPPARAARPAWAGPRFLLAAAAALVIVVGLVLSRRSEAPLAFSVDDAPPGQGYIQAGPAGAAARFSDGTRIALAGGARGRVVAVGARGARVSLEAGSARFDVVHRAGAEWIAEAGPFTVAVTGTAFDLSWSGTRVEIVMHAGSVVVRGPPAPDGIVLRAGQRLSADAARAEVSLVEAPSGALDRGPPPEPAVQPAAEPSAPATAAPRGEASARPRAPSWPARVAAGDFAGVLAEAEARGVDAALEETSLADLSALADAARYAGKTELSRRALTAERARFPGSAEARSAAFLLGRLSDSAAPAAAVTWYDRYLAEAPGGSLAAEALGRKMLALRASAGRDAARATAEEYLRRYPDGPFAPAAGDILRGP